MFVAKTLHGNPSEAAQYRIADNYNAEYRSASDERFKNKFEGKLSKILNFGEFSLEKFSEILDGKFGEGDDLRVKRYNFNKECEGDHNDSTSERNARIGLELNYACPKSISIEGLVFDQELFIEAHLAGTKLANKFIEENLLEFRINEKELMELRREGHDIKARLIDPKKRTYMAKAENMLVTSCLHTVSRLNKDRTAGGDPQIHSHDTIATHTMAYGKLRSLEYFKIFSNQHLIDDIYKYGMRQHLEKNNIKLKNVGYSYEVAGYERNDIEVFSDGSCFRIPKFIEEENLRRKDPAHPLAGKFLDVNNSADRSFANAQTRGTKADGGDLALDFESAQDWWAHKAANPSGNKRSVVLRELRERITDAQVKHATMEHDTPTAENAFDLAIGKALQNISTIRDKFDLLGHMMRFGQHQLAPEVLLNKIEEKLLSKELVYKREVNTQTVSEEALTSTHRVAVENETDALFKSGLNRFKAIAANKFIEQKIEEFHNKKGFKLSADQIAAARGVLSSTSEVTVVIGRAGTGKSTMMELIRDAAADAGFPTRAMAPSGKAKEALMESVGSDTDYVITTQRALLSSQWWEKQCKPGTVVICDEAGLVDAESMKGILERCREHRCRLVLVGDYEQYHPVGAGSPLAQLAHAAEQHGVRFVLSEMRRGKDRETQELHNLAYEKPAEAMQRLYEMGRLEIIEDKSAALQAIARHYSQIDESARDNTFVITGTNENRRLLNAAIRQEIGIDQRAGIEFFSFERFGGMTRADYETASNYETGMVITFNMTTKPFQKGESCEVVSVEGTRIKIARKICDKSGNRTEIVDFDPKSQSRGISLGIKEKITFAAGERVRFTTEFKKLKISNGERGIVESLDMQSRIAKIKLLESGRIVDFPLPEDSNGISIRHGYAATGHSSQGGTAKNGGHVIDYSPIEDLASFNSFYVNVTRSVKGARSYVQYTNALGADRAHKLISRVATPMNLDVAAADIGPRETKNSKSLLKKFFVGPDGFEKPIEITDGDLVDQLRNAKNVIGSEIGIRGGGLVLHKKIIKSAVDADLDITITNTGLGLRDYQTAQKTRREKEKIALEQEITKKQNTHEYLRSV